MTGIVKTDQIQGAGSSTVTIPSGTALNVTTVSGTPTFSGASTFSGDVTLPSINGGQISGRRNIIINGAMQVAQRGTSFTSVTASAYHLDRFQYNLVGTVGASTVTQNTVTDLPSFTKSLKVDVTTADASLAASDRLALCYKMEGQDLQQVAKGTSSAKQLTLSFYIKATKTGTQIVELFDHDNTRHCAKSVTINSSNTWEFKTINYPADTTGAFDNDNGNSLSIFFGLAVGTNFTTGTLATAWAANDNTNRFVGQVNHFDSTDNNFEITGVQLEVGSQATPFEHRSFGEEEQLCFRYCRKFDPAHFGRARDGDSFYGGGLHFFPPFRATPTLKSGADYAVNTGSGGAPAINGGLGPGAHSVQMYNSSANWTTNAFPRLITAVFEAEL